MTTTNRLIIWGAGTLGMVVAQKWLNHALGPVLGFTLTPRRHEALRHMGVAVQVDSPLAYLEPTDTLLLALPGHVNQQAAITALQQVSPPPQRVVLISSTGYYDSHNPLPAIIDEQTPHGNDPRAVTIAAMEHAFQTWAGSHGVILRSGGLYGLGRGPIQVLARRGYPKAGPAHKTLALLHYVDLATAIVAALQHHHPAPVYLAVTPPCPTRQEFYMTACLQLKLPPPEFTLSSAYSQVDYKVNLLRQDLLAQPLYPHWQSALNL